jgi:hypothetical protein
LGSKIKEGWLEKIKAIAVKRGGNCTSRSYVNAHSKLSFVCEKGHSWNASAATVIRGSWCPKCAIKCQHISQRTPFKEIYELIIAHNGTLLSTEKDYNETGELKVKCDKGHVFLTKAPRLRVGSFCLKCSYIRRGTKARLDISVAQKLALNRGGSLISKEYIGNSNKLEWVCKAGHHFKSTYSNVQKGTWCPICSRVISISERIVRGYLEKISGLKFEKIKPRWLVSSEGTYLELDGYNEECKLAFEHHGTQHYVESTFYKGEDFLKRKRDDETKERLCKKNGIRLLVVNQLFIKTSLEQLKSDIIAFLEKANAPIIENPFEVDLDINEFYNVNPLDVLRDICIKHDGKLLSTSYLGFKDKVEVKCKLGHIWKISPAKLKQGQWCPDCKWNKISAANRKYSIEDMKKVAHSKGGECLSSEYIANWQKLLWQCSVGHRWEANFANIFSGKWCPKCATSSNADSQRDSIEVYKKIAKKHGGELLSTSYNTAREKLKFRCKAGHIFERVAYDVKKKSKWCHACRREKAIVKKQ